MSANLYELCVNITANDSEAVNGINNVGKSTEGLSAKAVAMGQIMADAFEMVISKVAEYGQKIVQVGMDQESAFAKVDTIMEHDLSKGGMALEDMQTDIINLSNEMGISVGDLSDAVYNAISATNDTAGAVGLVEQASKLAVGGFTDTSSALSTLTTAMNAYGESAGTAEHISDSLMLVQNLGVTTVGELSASMGKAIASASAYGVNLENLESAYISITKAGINTAEGTTYISSMMKELGDSGSKVSGVLQEVSGKSFDQLMKEGASLGDVLEILNASVDGDATALMNLWSSAEAGKASSAIIGQGIDEFNDHLHKLETTTGTTETAFGIMADTLENKVGILQNTGANLMASMYNGMSEKLGDIVGFGQQLMDQLVAGFDQGGIGGLASALGDVLAKALSKLSEYLPQIMNVGMQIITSLIQGISSNSQLIASNLMIVIQGAIQCILDNLPAVLECGIVMISELAMGIAQSLPELVPTVIEVIISLVDTLISNADMLIDGAIALIIGLTEGIINSLPILIEKAPEIIMKLATALVENVPKLLQVSMQCMIQLGIALITYLPLLLSKVPSLMNELKLKFLEYVKNMTEVGKNLVDGLWQGLKDNWSTLVANLEALGDSLVSAFKAKFGIHSPSKVFAEIGEFCAEGFQQGISDLADGTIINDVQNRLGASLHDMKLGSISLDSRSAEAINNNQNITVVLQGDASRIFRLVQAESAKNVRLTGQPSFA